MTTVRAPRELVLASAGSGKTYRISSRFIGLLAAGVEPEEILASTFTRKAAGQILDRVLQRLARAVIDPDAARDLAESARLVATQPIPADSEYWAELLSRTVRRLHRLNIGTLDSFFLRAASAFEAEIGLSPGWSIAETHVARRIRSEALEQLLARADRDRLIQLIRLSARGSVRRSVEDHLDRAFETLVGIDEQLDPEAPDPWRAFERIAPVVREPSREERERLALAVERLPVPLTQKGTERANWRKALDRTAECLRRGDWDGLIAVGICQRVAAAEVQAGTSEAPCFDRVAIEGEVIRVYREVVEVVRSALARRLTEETAAYGELTRAYREHLRERQRREGRFDFQDITRLMAEGDPLGARLDLYYRLDARTRHLLLDEFQDTSLAQWEALAPIVDEVLSDEDRAAVIVADPKQSIYGWRGAEPSIVHAVGDRYRLSDHFLSESWRSSPVILDFVNRIFEGVHRNPVFVESERTAADWERDFTTHIARKVQLPGFVEIRVGPERESRGDTVGHCRAAAEMVARLRDDCPGFSIGVLTRTNLLVARLYLELRELGVPVSQEGGTPVTDSAACEAVLALFRLADHPADTVARYLVATGPLGPVVKLTLHTDDSAATRVARELRAELIRHGYGRTVSRLVAEVQSACDPRDRRRLQQLAELAYRFDDSASLRPSDFVRLAETERVEDRTTADVRVMTVHQSKGLEFDIVVLPQLDEPFFRGGAGSPVLPYRERQGGRITAVYPSVVKEIRCLFPALDEAEAQRRASIVRDGLSALYVALTRARYALHVLIAPPGNALTPARLIREALGDAIEGPLDPGREIFRMGDELWFKRPTAIAEGAGDGAPVALHPAAVRLVRSDSHRSLRRRSPSSLHGTGRVDLRDLLRLENTEALGRGSIIHAFFEAVEWIEDPLPDADRLRSAAARAAPVMESSRVEEIIAEFLRMAAAPPVRAALSRARYGGVKVTVERELPFLRRIDDTLMEGVIDRLVLTRDKHGSVTSAEVLDFKTDRVSADRLEESVAYYRPQLQAYVDAVADIYRVPPDRCAASLIFLEPGEVRSVAGGSHDGRPDPLRNPVAVPTDAH